MVNKELSLVFDQIADLMEIQGGDRFRINSYRRVARIVKDLAEDIGIVADEGRLTDLEGIGKGTADRIQQYIQTGTIDVHQELLAKVPTGLPSLLAIPGLGPKKVALAWKKLGVGNVDDLKRVIASGELAELPGLGTQSVKKIADGLAFLERSKGRTPMGLALPLAEELIDQMGKIEEVQRIEPAGSLRRGRETVGDLDLLCQTTAGKKVVDTFASLDPVRRVLAAGTTKGSVTIDLPGGREMQVDLRAVEPKAFGAALQYFTGSKEHNVRLREIAVKKGWKLNEYGLFDGDKQIAGKTEEGIYTKLGLKYIPPELREDRGEFTHDSAGLIALDDIRGDLHVHTVASDGKCTIEEIASAARDLGYAYIAICDHSKSSAIANGLSIERMWKQIEDVRAADKRAKGIAIFVGTECDILASGKLDYPDDLLAEIDVVIASIHSGLGQDRKTVTRRTIAAMENPHVDIIGHPTGRLLGQREAMDLDIQQVIDVAKATDTALELNASWQRLDLNDIHARQAVEAGVKLAISTDAHRPEQLPEMRLGVQTARRAWVRPEAVVNTLSAAALREWLRRSATKT